MLVRIVRMEFEPEKVYDFLKIFNNSKKRIRNFSGCSHLELHQDLERPNVYFTYSIWNKPEDLERYRNSELFKETWEATKVLFSAAPVAYSMNRVETMA